MHRARPGTDRDSARDGKRMVPDDHGGSRPAPGANCRRGRLSSRGDSCTATTWSNVRRVLGASAGGSLGRPGRSGAPRCAAPPGRQREVVALGRGSALAITTATYGRKQRSRDQHPPQPARADQRRPPTKQTVRMRHRDARSGAAAPAMSSSRLAAAVVIRTASRSPCWSRAMPPLVRRYDRIPRPLRPSPRRHREAPMSNRTYRVTEIVGTSPDGIDQAIRNGIERAARPCATSTGSRSPRCAARSRTAPSSTSRSA